MKDQMKARLLGRKIESQFPVSPEARLMYSIVECALVDSVKTIGQNKKGEKSMQDLQDRSSARRYLSGDMVHCEMCGVSSEWVRGLITKIDLFTLEQLVSE